ncbi:hypothetical protein [Archangium sp.]|uniref:hypothetical protein n=1 Tax=Archangium sp. TaxID=1872627 RepID=UPI002D2FB104|nr:hypothetical protein [Archangium sp.]HYO55189.1 hypothetical protein [Archangium sp.]
MKKKASPFVARSSQAMSILVLSLLAGGGPAVAQNAPKAADALVGAWVVEADGAPFKQHLFVFHADHTMLQSNPPAGNRMTSDSNGIGVWRHEKGREFIGKFVEHNADHETGQFLTQLTVSYRITVNGSTFTGTAEANYKNAEGVHVRGPLPAKLRGTRITLP